MSRHLIAVSRGHGTGTPGKRSPDGEREWYFNDQVADAFVDYLDDYDVDILEVSDPDGSTDTPLETRTNKANARKAVLYMAFHHNAFQGVWFNGGGTEVHVRPYAPQSYELASRIAPKIAEAMGLTNRGVKVTNLHETREPDQLAVLIEGGFMDSRQDIVALRNPDKLKAQGVAVAKEVVKYLGLKKGKSNVTAPKAKPKSKSKKSVSAVAKEIAQGVGGWGNGNTRKRRLKDAGYNYNAVQKKVNALLMKKQKPKNKTIEQMAQEVRLGLHGDGHSRRRKSLGVSEATYQKVRNRVNQFYR